jgi:hypothetical protein
MSNDIITYALPEFSALDPIRDAVENTLDVYWEMLMQMESHTDPKKDILNKDLVERAYKNWNMLHPQSLPIKPRWA